MRRTSLMTAALAVVAFGAGLSEANGQWAEVSTVRYGLFGRPRAIETQLVPTVTVLPTTRVVSTGTIIGDPVVTTRYVQAVPTSSVVRTMYAPMGSEVISSGFVTSSSPIMSTGVISSGPVIRSYYSPTVRVVEPSVFFIP